MNIQSIFCITMATCLAPFLGWFAGGRDDEIYGRRPVVDKDEAIDDELRAYLAKRKHFHPAVKPKAVSIGGYEVWAAGGMYLMPRDLEGYDLLVPLTQHMPFGSGKRYQILAVPMRDYGGACHNFHFCLEEIVSELKKGTRMLIYCDGGLGRTGTILASLTALLETKEQTPDPIAAIRNRYNEGAVETYEQVEAVFQLRGQRPPSDYDLLKQLDFFYPVPLNSSRKDSCHQLTGKY